MSGAALIVHAGMHKTGTSAIQNYLFHHLEHPDFGYFSDGTPNSSLLMLQAFKHDLDQLPNFAQEHWAPGRLQRVRATARERFATIARQCNRPTTILSAESISMFREDESGAFRDMAGEFFADIQVVLYLRPSWSRLESAFQERLKTRFTPLDQPIVVNFKRFESVFDNFFGRDNVHLRRYRREEFPGGSVVADFLGFAGIPYGSLPAEGVNTALSLPAIQLLYIYRKFYPHLAPGDEAMVAALGELEGEKFRMHRSVAERAIKEGPKSAEWLQARAGFSLQEDRAEDECGIKDEAEMLAVPTAALEWLQARGVGRRYRRLSSNDPERIADALRALANRHVGKHTRRRSRLRWWS